MKRFLLAASLVLLPLAACGVDGPPERPGDAVTGVTISGTLRAGIARDGG